MLLSIVSLCSETEIEESDEQTQQIRLSGSATENALVQAALDHGIDVVELRHSFPRRAVQHRSETYRFMTTMHGPRAGFGLPSREARARYWRSACGKPCRRAAARVLKAARRSEIEAQNAAMAAQALRVLGMAYREIRGPHDHTAEHASDIDRLIWTGLVGLADPVRQGLPELMHTLHRAGIQTLMLTGDQSATARAVAERIGLSAEVSVEIVDASDLDRLGPAEVAAAARRAHAFARISPAQKLRIVRALQDAGAVVAMVGDGINDSPALRAANVGMAIGRHGDAAAREVADVFFAGEDLQMLPLAIERGRGTYTNIRKAIHYMLSTNTSEILLMLAGAAAGFGEMLSPMQLLWINLISDVLPAIGLAMEPPEPDAMERGPTDANEPMVRRDQMGRLGTEAGDSDRERLRGRALRGHAVRAELARGAHPRLREPHDRAASARARLPLVPPERVRARRALREPAAPWDHRRFACCAARGHAGTRRAQRARHRPRRAPGCHGHGYRGASAISHQRGGASQRNGPGRV